MGYCSASDISNLTQNLVSPETTFTTSTSPTLAAVRDFISTGCAIIETRLSARGYSTPVASTAGAYGWLKQLNTFYGAYLAEMSRTNIVLQPGERTRAQLFLQQFNDGMKMLVDMDLTTMGIGKSTTGTIYAGGTSKSDKTTRRDDSDNVRPRFSRGQYAFPGTVRPDGYTLEDEND